MKSVTIEKTLFSVVYVVRCASSATLSYFLARAAHLPYPVWAAMSAVIISQTELHETRESLLWRIIGTIAGVLVSSLVDFLTRTHLNVGWQIMMSVGICAVFASRYPLLRVSMWTAPIVLLTASSTVPVIMTGFYRGAEVILGCIVGGVFHVVSERLMSSLGLSMRPPPPPPTPRRLDDD